MTNQYGVSREDNDRLLELMGGCRHEWVRKPCYTADYSVEDDWLPRKRTTNGAICHKCHCIEWEYLPDLPLDAVGDGHDVTLGEMVRLWLADDTHWLEIAREHDGHRVVLLQPGPTPDVWRIANTPEAALCAAILAAKAKE